jgi:hypothetical protein
MYRRKISTGDKRNHPSSLPSTFNTRDLDYKTFCGRKKYWTRVKVSESDINNSVVIEALARFFMVSITFACKYVPYTLNESL